mmetsp:Transcript_6667/g.23718  ORF Transcript_6667/g.23718 Transcript_6667/m.23718 type:complete len:305 (-) Transcript_6667:831-1745(-)
MRPLSASRSTSSVACVSLLSSRTDGSSTGTGSAANSRSTLVRRTGGATAPDARAAAAAAASAGMSGAAMVKHMCGARPGMGEMSATSSCAASVRGSTAKKWSSVTEHDVTTMASMSWCCSCSSKLVEPKVTTPPRWRPISVASSVRSSSLTHRRASSPTRATAESCCSRAKRSFHGSARSMKASMHRVAKSSSLPKSRLWMVFASADSCRCNSMGVCGVCGVCGARALALPRPPVLPPLPPVPAPPPLVPDTARAATRSAPGPPFARAGTGVALPSSSSPSSDATTPRVGARLRNIGSPFFCSM